MRPVALPAIFLRTPLAHRALHDRTQRRPENSLAAISAAIAVGYGIEIDLQLSSDGQPMVFHDDDLDRLTLAKGPITHRTATELRAITVRDSDDPIPTFTEVLALIAGRVPLLVEIKDQDGTLGPNVGALEAATAAALHAYPGPVALMSFNPHSVAALARLAPDLPRGLITSAFEPTAWSPLPAAICDRLREIPDYSRTAASFISHEWTDLARPRVADLKAQGAAILCWTIRSPTEEAEARKIADNITFERYQAAHLH